MHKAQVLNTFVADHEIRSVIEFGCGDGHQLSLATYASYIGLDVSAIALARCCRRFQDDHSKSFYLYDSSCFVDHARLFYADMAISLDVIFHLVENEVYIGYMRHLFDAAKRFVIIYSSDFDAAQVGHEKRRCFSLWVSQNRPDWQLITVIRNSYPYDEGDPDNTSLSDFYVYCRA